MKIQLLCSASVVIETNGVKILTDPWLVDGEYYGSWAHYPPYDFRPDDFADIDYIYLSHVHPDHMSGKTLRQLNHRIPVLIHSYEAKFLKRNVEALGFGVTELPNNQRTHLRNGVHINILAADNCNPELCARFFGCGAVEARFGSTQIDSLAVIDDGQHVVVNVNDCPFELASRTLEVIRPAYGKVDLLLVGYGGAGPYPQCFASLTLDQKVEAAKRKSRQFLEQGAQYVAALEPRFYVPFAGTYVLAGKLAGLTELRGVPALEDAATFFRESHKIDSTESVCVLLNHDASFDLKTEQQSRPYEPTDPEQRASYIRGVLAARPLSYESAPTPSTKEILDLIPAAYERMDRKRREIGFSSETRVWVRISDDEIVDISMNGDHFEVRHLGDANDCHGYVMFEVDRRLLYDLLRGPRYAHWNNAEIGSHIEFRRAPDVFERALYYSMCFFHA